MFTFGSKPSTYLISARTATAAAASSATAASAAFSAAGAGAGAAAYLIISSELDFLVALQAFLTVVGNCTCWWAAWRIYTAAQAEQQAPS
jgi:hypothetical protein